MKQEDKKECQEPDPIKCWKVGARLDWYFHWKSLARRTAPVGAVHPVDGEDGAVRPN